MARITRRGCVGESSRMTTVAGYALMRASQCEARLVVRPAGWLPIACAVTLCAICRESRQRVIWINHSGIVGMMTCIAGRRSTRVTTSVTLVARGRAVRA